MTPVEYMFWALYALVVFLGILFALKYAKRVYRSSWYDTSWFGPNGEVRWELVKNFSEQDPMNVASKRHSALWSYRWPLRYLIRDVPVLFFVGLFLYSVGCWILENGAHVGLKEAEKLAIIVGGGTLFVTAIGIFFNSRISSRTVNRQAWINELRQEMNGVIGNIPSFNANSFQVTQAVQHLNGRHTLIELYLNPSEPIHRAFMALVRHMYQQYDVAIDQDVRAGLSLVNQHPPNIDEWRELKSKVIRIGNVLLKREWEQVKLIA